MTECGKLKAVERWFDGEDSVNSRQIEQHIAACPHCAAHLRHLRRLRGAVQAVPDPPSISDAQFSAYCDGVRRRVERSGNRHWGLWITATVTAVFLLVAAPLAGTFFGEDTAGQDTLVLSWSTELEGARVRTSQNADGMATVWVDWSEVDG